MVHKFMSYFGVPLNGSFTIERTFVIFIVFHLRSKILFICFIFNRKSYEICLNRIFISTSLNLSSYFKHGELVRSPLLLNCFIHYDTLWRRYKLVACANHDQSFMRNYMCFSFHSSFKWS
ncbi:hypothetical protein HanIR_Chr15g0777441 [Helianthus annuus]|nr:hypothetical protein HanIR_Chr15g0777441 [Helianthus annuus]